MLLKLAYPNGVLIFFSLTLAEERAKVLTFYTISGFPSYR